MKQVMFPANERGHANHGWLDSYHSFSFASYQNPNKVHFGALRVLNDDVVAGGQGFGKHPHDNMEIISIPLSGALQHQDDTGRDEVIKAGDVQMMSAGKGITHAEFNASKTDPVNFLQIWIFPKERNITPLYQQVTFNNADFADKITAVVAPEKLEKGLVINQDAWLSMGKLSAGKTYNYKVQKEGNGVYVFVIEGGIAIDATTLNKRDAIGISETGEIAVTAKADSQVLFIDVPMKF